MSSPMPARSATGAARRWRSQLGANRPEVGEHRLEEGRAEVADPRGAARPRPGADRPLHHLDVAIAPLLEPLVEVDHALADLGGLAGVAVGGEDRCLDALRLLDGERD